MILFPFIWGPILQMIITLFWMRIPHCSPQSLLTNAMQIFCISGTRKVEARKQLTEAMSHRMHIDDSIALVGKLLFGIEKGPEVLNRIRPTGEPLVDDWDCLKSFVRTFETHCGSLSQYGMKHMRAVANICNSGIKMEQIAKACAQACLSIPSNSWSSLDEGFSA